MPIFAIQVLSCIELRIALPSSSLRFDDQRLVALKNEFLKQRGRRIYSGWLSNAGSLN